MKPLNPVMAAVLAASSAAFALPGTARAKTPPPPPTPASKAANTVDCSKLGDMTDPYNAVFCLAKKPEVRAAIGERFLAFAEGKDGVLYVSPDLMKPEAAKEKAGMEALIKGWPEQNKDNPGKIASLYYVMGVGSGGVPAWAAPAPIIAKVMKPVDGKPWPLLDGLHAGLTDDKHRWNTDNILKPGQKLPGEAVAFLNNAAEIAQWKLDHNYSLKDILGRVATDDVTGSNPPLGTQKPTSAVPMSSGSNYSFNELYIDGARLMRVYGPDDDGYRVLSIKQSSYRDATGASINRLQIVDITGCEDNPDSPSCQPSPTRYVELDAKKATVEMGAGGRHYEVELDGKGGVTVKRPGGTVTDQTTTSLTELGTLRNQQMIKSGATVTIGGKEFFALGQGGHNGSVLFFDKSQVLADKNGTVHPLLMADVATTARDGSSVQATGKPDLGVLPDGTPWHLEFDGKLGMWKVVSGEGDKKQAPPKSTGTNQTDPGTTNGSTTTTNGNSTPDVGTNTKFTSLDQAVEYFKKTPDGWQDCEECNAGFNPDAKAHIRILSVGTGKLRRFLAVFSPDMGVADGAKEVKLSDGTVIRMLRGAAGSYVLMDAGQIVYRDYRDFAKWLSGDANGKAKPILATKEGIADVTDIEVLIDHLTHYRGVKSDDPMIAKIRAAVAKYKGNGGYRLTDGKASKVPITVNLVAEKWSGMIYPHEMADASDPKNQAQTFTGIQGPGTVLEFSGSVGDPKSLFPSKEQVNATEARIDSKTGIALYATSEDETLDGGAKRKTTVWKMMVAYKGKDGALMRTDAIAVFGGEDRFKLPAGYKAEGLLGQTAELGASFMVLHASTQEKGAIAAYNYVLPDAQGGQNVRDKKGNCIGPVIWWGGWTKAQALAACKSDSKAN